MKKTAIFFLLIFLLSCSNKYHRFTSNYNFRSNDGKPEYSNLDYWAANPLKHNTSDSVPKPLLENYHRDSSVDIFFIHPTSYTDMKIPFGWNAPIDNAELNAKTDYSSILYQASVFNEAGRIFAPRYRQANLKAYYPITKEDTANAVAALDLAYQDIKNAFEYYMQHYNKDKPIIIASHSQGTTHAKRLLKEFFDGKPLQKKLIAAYVVGIFVEPDLFTNIKACETSTQTGCICSWRTFKEGYKPDFVKNEKFAAIVTNPITWNATNTAALRSENKGSVLFNFNKLYRGVVDAKTAEGVLWTRKPKFLGNLFYVSKNYHIADYNFYYLSIRKNVEQRIKEYLKK